MTIIQTDLIKSFERPDHFGIYLPFVLERIEQNIRYPHFDSYEIEQFILEINDLEEVLQMNIKQFYEWGN
ncbi:hypothetical protein [Paenibacillus periandrae]|uniref:hypothetical protein n=1 Tax=Paenibacillus periandrae TaxID=1761741 RepID=UPI001F08BBA8|nr:hypothetical protein [Paenibacillus periandrae]